MKDWNPDLYLKFKDERTQPSIDLVHRIVLDFAPESILDVGCGPGNSSQILIQRWPNSRLTGLDSSTNMIEKAKQTYPDQTWILADAATYESENKYDVVFSNATIQWIPDHENLIEHFYHLLSHRGCLAVQVPLFWDMPLGKNIEKVAQNPKWHDRTRGVFELFTMHNHSFYYDVMSRYFETIALWESSYMHVMASHDAILEMIRSTGMKPYLERLDGEEEKRDFEKQVRHEILADYPIQEDGRVLFPFKRLFFIGNKPRK